MKLLVAPCEFKETLTPREAAEVIGEALKDNRIPYTLHPVGDGGGGTLNALEYNLKGKLKFYDVHDPTFKEIKALIFYYKNFAFIEMANASGLKLVPEDKRDPLYLSSIGTGELIRYAIEEGYKNIYIGIGGSATIDGGIGALYALGIRFYNKDGEELKPVGKSLITLSSLKVPEKTLNMLKDVKIHILSDVKNPLLGVSGATRVFGPQKGLKEEFFTEIENGLSRLAQIIYKITGRDMSKVKGGGAAGGIGGALYALFGAKIEEGATFFLKITDFVSKLKDVSIVITGEGIFDEQSLEGKAPYETAKLAKKHGKTVIVLCGEAKINPHKIKCVDAIFSIVNGLQTKKEAFKKARENLYFTTYNLARLLKKGEIT